MQKRQASEAMLSGHEPHPTQTGPYSDHNMGPFWNFLISLERLWSHKPAVEYRSTGGLGLACSHGMDNTSSFSPCSTNSSACLKRRRAL